MDLLDRLDSLDDLASELDYDYSVNERHISTMEQFREELLAPFQDPGRMLFYRGERISCLSRPLLPTLFRDRSLLIPPGECCADIDSDRLLELYRSYGRYFDLFCSTFGHAHKYRAQQEVRELSHGEAAGKHDVNQVFHKLDGDAAHRAQSEGADQRRKV